VATPAAIFPPTQPPERRARMFPGRLTAGIGHGVAGWMSQVGGQVESPMTLLREYTAALYALLHGDTVTTHGRYVHLDDVALDWPPTVAPPLLVGGIRPRTISLAGELADGLILTGGVTPDDTRTALGHFHRNRATDAGPARPVSRSTRRAAMPISNDL
jgi:alkanesulfonate monooxygenase SsuD/methylene tetrahydromethanopterin reductase-like flavin-dependent oxidoreductase (luciferase family)